MKRVDPEKKALALRMLGDGAAPGLVATTTKISLKTIYGWKAKRKKQLAARVADDTKHSEKVAKSTAAHDAILFLRQYRDVTMKELRNGEIKKLSKKDLLALWSLAELEG
jgi:transposase